MDDCCLRSLFGNSRMWLEISKILNCCNLGRLFIGAPDKFSGMAANVSLHLENAAILFRFHSQQISVMDAGVNLLKIYKLQETGR